MNVTMHTCHGGMNPPFPGPCRACADERGEIGNEDAAKDVLEKITRWLTSPPHWDNNTDKAAACELMRESAEMIERQANYKAAAAKLADQVDGLLAALKDARELIRRDYTDAALAAGCWPTVKPRVDALDAVIAQSEGK